MLSLPLGWLKNTKRDQWMSQVLCWSDWSGELTDWKETQQKTWENVTSGRGFPQHTANTTTRQASASAQLGLYTRDYFWLFATINLKPTTTQEFKKKNMLEDAHMVYMWKSLGTSFCSYHFHKIFRKVDLQPQTWGRVTEIRLFQD